MKAPELSSMDYADLVASAAAAIAAAEDTHLSPAMAEANQSRLFDSRSSAHALQVWIEKRLAADENFDTVDFLRAFLQKHPRNIAAMVLLALEFRKRGDKEQSAETINAALSVRRYDLYIGEVARSLFAWASDQAEEDLDEWLKGRYCPTPFSNFDTMPNGDVFMCCGDWLPVSIGNIFRNTAEEIWNSPIANDIRSSIIDGSFRFCSKLSCQYIVNRDLPETAVTPPPIDGAVARPSRVVLSHDNSCNLSCPSCRAEVIIAKKKEQDKLNTLVEKVFVPLLRSATTARISGSGDPFASHHYRTLLKRINREEFPDLWIDLHTNAQLFDQKAWEDLQLKGKVGHVEISIDAATSRTYNIVRRGGSFERLLDNLEFIKQLRINFDISCLVFSFVVQQQNYREMPAFVMLAERYRADFVEFRSILDWGTCSPEEFNRRFIGSPNHPEYANYLEILDQPELHRPNVRIPPYHPTEPTLSGPGGILV